MSEVSLRVQPVRSLARHDRHYDSIKAFSPSLNSCVQPEHKDDVWRSETWPGCIDGNGELILNASDVADLEVWH